MTHTVEIIGYEGKLKAVNVVPGESVKASQVLLKFDWPRVIGSGPGLRLRGRLD